MPDIIRVRCGGCDVKIKAPLKYQGRRVNCPQCGTEVSIPLAESTRPAIFDSSEPAPLNAAVAPLLATPAVKESSQRPAIARPRPNDKDSVTVLDDDAFVDPKPAAKKPPRDDFGNIDFADYEDYGPVEDYGAPPKRNSSSGSSASAKRTRKKKSTPAKASGDSTIDPSIVGGIVMMVGAAVWFFVGLSMGILFFYPPVLFVIGIVAFVKGLLD